MAIINLKEIGIEAVLNEVCLSEEDVKKIRGDFDYYDEYYLTASGKFIKAFQQEFVKDPYMDLPPIQKLRLITYQTGVALNELEQIFEMSNVPIITKTHKDVLFPGFDYILNKRGRKTELVPIRIAVPDMASDYNCPFIRQMSDTDLSEITELFRTEYSLRYRMIQLMFPECPEACFVYEREGKILGVTFNRIDGDELYMRQLFVREGCREEGIGNALYENRLKFARELGLKKGRANIRAETRSFRKRYSARLSEDDIMYYIIRGG